MISKHRVLLALLPLFLASCIYEGMNECPPNLYISYDWTHSVYPGDTKQLQLQAFDTNNREAHIETTTSSGASPNLPDGKYNILVTESVENIQYTNYTVKAHNIQEQFSAGETLIEIINGTAQGNPSVPMIQQTRELIVNLRIIGESHLKDVNQINATLTNVTISRDISQGFPPRDTHRTINPAEYADLDMAFSNTPVTGNEINNLFRARTRLLGLPTDKELLFTFTTPSQNPPENNPVLFTFDATLALDQFHTLTDTREPYIINIDLQEDEMNGQISIIDWEIGDVDDLIGTED